MSEPLIFEIRNVGPWDGSTVVSLTRDDFTRAGNYYTGNVGVGGVIKSDFFGLMAATVPKLVSIAVQTYDPNAFARVTRADADVFGVQLDLTPAFQTVMLAAGDVLRINTAGGPGATDAVLLMVNEMSEAEFTAYSSRELRPRSRTSRLRVTRGDTAEFTLAPSAPLVPSFDYNPANGYLEAITVSQGYISVQQLARTGSEGVYVWVRYTGLGAGAGEVHVVDARTDESRLVQDLLVSTLWSDSIWLSRDDRLAFRSSAPPAGSAVCLEIEVSPVRQRRVED